MYNVNKNEQVAELYLCACSQPLMLVHKGNNIKEVFTMKAKRLLSVILAALVTVSCCAVLSAVPAVSAADNAISEYNTYAKYQEAIKPENNYGLADTVNEGKILQAWNWSYKNAIALMETVAEQGFTTIQISPPNEIKMATKGVKVCEPAVNGVAPNGWWMFYQPAGFQLNESEDNALGTKAEYIEMCEVAHQYGVKIIADAVINHMGTDDKHTGPYNNKSTDPMDHVNERAQLFEPELLAAKAFHSPWADMTYKENYWDGWSDYDIEYDLTRNCTSGLPDLATETQLVQDTIYDYFVELMEAGTDGFRFDAAKHIETSHDTYVASDFWEDTLLKLRANYPDVECYAYGEILNKCGDGRPFHEYTELMDVTDSSSYWGIKDAICNNGNSGNSIPYYQSEAEGCDPKTVNFTKENVIQWNESHDTYIDGGTSSLTIQQRNKIWAVTAARQTITGVYFARPDDRTGNGRSAIEAICANITLGDANKTSWTNAEVQAVNRFGNFFGDAAEYNSVQNKVTFIERSNNIDFGATLVNLSGTSKNVSITTHILGEGKYIDALTGNEFVVEGKTLKGQIGSTGIACIYYAEDEQAPAPLPTIDDVQIVNGQYPINDDYTTIVYSTNWGSANIYAWETDSNVMTEWPGTPMKFALVNDYGENQFVAYIPKEYTHFIINDGNGQQTIDLDISDNCGVYMADWKDGKFTVGYWDPDFFEWNPPSPDPSDDPTTEAPTEKPSDDPTEKPSDDPTEKPSDDPTEKPSDDPTEKPSDDPTEKPSDDPTEEPTNPPVPAVMLGDADGNNTVNVKDATAIQKVVAGLEVAGYVEAAADANEDGSVNVKDATAIQKWVAGLLEGSNIGK